MLKSQEGAGEVLLEPGMSVGLDSSRAWSSGMLAKGWPRVRGATGEVGAICPSGGAVVTTVTSKRLELEDPAAKTTEYYPLKKITTLFYFIFLMNWKL